MSDRIASFLFDYATVLMPVVIVLSAIAAVFLLRRWPGGLLRRAGRVILLVIGRQSYERLSKAIESEL